MAEDDRQNRSTPRREHSTPRREFLVQVSAAAAASGLGGERGPRGPEHACPARHGPTGAASHQPPDRGLEPHRRPLACDPRPVADHARVVHRRTDRRAAGRLPPQRHHHLAVRSHAQVRGNAAQTPGKRGEPEDHLPARRAAGLRRPDQNGHRRDQADRHGPSRRGDRAGVPRRQIPARPRLRQEGQGSGDPGGRLHPLSRPRSSASWTKGGRTTSSCARSITSPGRARK